jgi:hypothetical protein
MDQHQPGPIDWASFPKTREAWIEAHLLPGEKLADFLPPPPIAADRHPAADRVVARPVNTGARRREAVLFVVAMVAWPLLAFAFSWFMLFALLGWLGWCFWPRPGVKRWKAPREIPPWPMDAVAASARHRRGEPREGDLYAP